MMGGGGVIMQQKRGKMNHILYHMNIITLTHLSLQMGKLEANTHF
jgi:hypothetical protein